MLYAIVGGNEFAEIYDLFERGVANKIVVKSIMNGKQRVSIRPGMRVAVVLKQDQRTGKRTVGTVKDLLTNSANHPHGIKVRLTDGQVGRVQEILADEK